MSKLSCNPEFVGLKHSTVCKLVNNGLTTKVAVRDYFSRNPKHYFTWPFKHHWRNFGKKSYHEVMVWAGLDANERDARIISAAESAADWMCEASPGTDQFDRGLELRVALEVFKNTERCNKV